ncbi:hypothetical protein RHGRI_008929 [Rhododendron griersonianum]|uniref:BHLH domain-containing protein n=1 Tax=Rhododendron griersonianum TaxID=479676 RepID=A0AAV6L2E9_9ERIC|nr:hypothetical protein RHGRI_008929 [Rhododendron griersonianum]
MFMDYIFLLDEGARPTFLRNLAHSSGCTYICLWRSYLPQRSNSWLISLDGFYNEENIRQPSSSSGSLARRLFDEYRKSFVAVDNIEYDTNPKPRPGACFQEQCSLHGAQGTGPPKTSSICSTPAAILSADQVMKLLLNYLQEARIKTAIFMGCMAGEIELGFSSDTTQVNWEMEMRKWMPENFPDQQAPYQDLPHPVPDHQTRASSSSSSLRSLSTDNSLEPSPFLFNIPPNTSYHQEPPKQPPIHEQAFRPTSSSVTLSPLHQAIQSFNQTRNFPFPTPETEDDAITRAILAVLSSPSPSASPSASSPQPSVAQNFPSFSRNATSAFNRYRPGFAHSSSTPMIARVGRSSMLKRAISFCRSLSSVRNQGRVQAHGGSRPTENQLYHMISERKRREKLNESFQALRSLLPPGTKKDKASVLSGTSEYLNSLRSQVVELTRRNQVLEAQLLPKTKPRDDQEGSDESSYRRLDVKVENVVAAESSSSSGARIVDLFVAVRGGGCDILGLVIRIMEFLRKDERVGFISVEADTKVEESISVNRVVSRLKIEGNEWDESTFQEAVRKVVADLAK